MFLVGLFILVLVFSSFGVAMSQRDRGVWKEIDAFVLQNLNTVKEPNGVNILTKMVLKRFGNELDAEIKTYGKELTPAQREQLKYLLVSDYISYLYQKSLIPKNAKKVIVKPIADKGPFIQRKWKSIQLVLCPIKLFNPISNSLVGSGQRGYKRW